MSLVQISQKGPSLGWKVDLWDYFERKFKPTDLLLNLKSTELGPIWDFSILAILCYMLANLSSWSHQLEMLLIYCLQAPPSGNCYKEWLPNLYRRHICLFGALAQSFSFLISVTPPWMVTLKSGTWKQEYLVTPNLFSGSDLSPTVHILMSLLPSPG